MIRTDSTWLSNARVSVFAAVMAGFGLASLVPVAGAQSAHGNITTWSVQVNTPDWNKNLGVTGARQGCSASPSVCVDNLRKITQMANVRTTLVVPLNATSTANDATQYSQLSLSAPFLVEVGIDDFVDQYTALSRVSQQPAAVVNTVIANLKSANPALKFGGTIYDDQFASPYLQDARLPAATRAQFDYVHLFVHFRQNGLNFEHSVSQAKQMFPNALIIAGSYAYDRRAYIPCTPGGSPCTTQQDLDLFSQTLTIQAQLLANKTVDSIEFYPGYFGNEDKWTGWSNPRECAPGDLANCIANTRTIRQAALTILNGGAPPKGTPLTTIATMVGNGGADHTGDNGPATAAQIYGPTAVALDRNSGDLYVVDAGNYVVRRVDANGVIHAFAGNTSADNQCSAGPPTNVGLGNPQGVAVDKSGNVYITDAACAMVFKVDAAGKALTIVAGGLSPTSTGTGDGGPATNAQLAWPVGVAVDNDATVYIADAFANTIRSVDKGGIIHTLAGKGTADFTGDGGAATAAALSSPSGVAVDAAGNIYIADTGNSVVRRVDKSGIIHTFAGSAVPGYAGDEGPATAAQLQSPQGVAVDSYGGVYIADSGNNVIRMVDTSHVIHAVAGNGTGDFAGDGGLPVSAELAQPAGVAEVDLGLSGTSVDSVRVYIADTLNNRVRYISTPPPHVAP